MCGAHNNANALLGRPLFDCSRRAPARSPADGGLARSGRECSRGGGALLGGAPEKCDGSLLTEAADACRAEEAWRFECDEVACARKRGRGGDGERMPGSSHTTVNGGRRQNNEEF